MRRRIKRGITVPFLVKHQRFRDLVNNNNTVLPRLVRRRTIKLMSFLIKKTINLEQFIEIFGIF